MKYTVRRYFVVYDTVEVEAEDHDHALLIATDEPLPALPFGVFDAEQWESFDVDTSLSDNEGTRFYNGNCDRMHS